ncbi:MAG: thiamine diphosphokinase [Thermodesulfobacteriota bacterium]|nr:thiamine diphosphokinase [Thermodesulfobacteriota bacterium]
MILIVSGGKQPPSGFLRECAQRADRIIAADKGAQYCLDAGVIPDLVVGDMDSISGQAIEGLDAMGVERVFFNQDKDMTDTSIALDEAAKKGADRVEIVAGLGGRLDHTLANVHLLLRALRSGMDAIILAEDQEVFIVDSGYTLINKKGAIISFLPLTSDVSGIDLKGFAYGLDHARMEIGDPYGISNVVNSDHACIGVDKGVLLAILVRNI